MNLKDIKFKQFMCKSTLTEDLQLLTRRDSRLCCLGILSLVAFRISVKLPSGFQSSCLGNNALLPLGKNALLPFAEECHATTRDNALLPSQLGSQHYLVWLLRGFSAWLLIGPLSLAPYDWDFQLGFQEGLSSFAAQNKDLTTWLPEGLRSLSSQKTTVQFGYPEGSLDSVSSGLGHAVGTLFSFHLGLYQQDLLLYC